MKTQIRKQHTDASGVQQPTKLNATFNLGVLSRTFLMLTLVIAAFVVPATAQPCLPPLPYMIAWYSFDDSFQDYSGLGNAAVPHGTMMFGYGEVSDAAFFEHNSVAYAEAPPDQSLNIGEKSFTVFAWVNIPPGDATGSRIIIDKRSGTGTSLDPVRGYSFFLYNGRLGLSLGDGVGTPGSTTYLSGYPPFPLDDGNWHLIAVTVARPLTTGGRWYIDGQPFGYFNPTGRKGSLTSSAPLDIGAIEAQFTAPPNDRRWFIGGMDELQIITQVASPDYILTLYNRGPYGNCKN